MGDEPDIDRIRHEADRAMGVILWALLATGLALAWPIFELVRRLAHR